MFWRRKPAEVDLEARREPAPHVNSLVLGPADMVLLYRRDRAAANEQRNRVNSARRALKLAGHESVNVMAVDCDLQIKTWPDGDEPTK